jgi:hypothetical protein
LASRRGDAGDRSTEEVSILIAGVHLEDGQEELIDKLATQVVDVGVDDAEGLRLFDGGFEVGAGLTEVGRVGRDVPAVLLEPVEDDSRICPTTSGKTQVPLK